MIMIMLVMAYDDECTAQQCQVAVAPTLSGFNDDDDDDYDDDDDDDRIEDGVNDGDE